MANGRKDALTRFQMLLRTRYPLAMRGFFAPESLDDVRASRAAASNQNMQDAADSPNLIAATCVF